MEGSRTRLALLVGASVLGGAVVCLRLLRPLGDAWNPDEWYLLGANLFVDHTLGYGAQATVFRPPGYPAFVAAVLSLGHGRGEGMTPALLWGARSAVYLAQAVFLALAAAGATLWWSERMSPAIAAAGALALCANPYVLALVGLPHYALLHMVSLVLGGWALAAALRRGGLGALAACGVLWGAITLMRPVTLPLPAVVVALLWLRGERGRRLAERGCAFALGCALVVAPWTVRNYELRGRFVPVNAQGWTVLWAATEKPMPARPNHFNWYSVARGKYEAAFGG